MGCCCSTMVEHTPVEQNTYCHGFDSRWVFGGAFLLLFLTPQQHVIKGGASQLIFPSNKMDASLCSLGQNKRDMHRMGKKHLIVIELTQEPVPEWPEWGCKDEHWTYFQAIEINQTIKTLNLSSNRLNFSCCKYLASVLRQNRTLKDLDLSCNNLEEGGARILYNDGIKHNTRIRRVGYSTVIKCLIDAE